MKKANASYRRRNYFIDRKFQSKFIIKFCSLVVVGGLITIGLLYFFAMQSTTVSIINSRVVVRTTADFLLPVLIQTSLIVTVIVSLAVIAVTLFTSHKIAGPLYRFKKVIEALESGDFSSDFSIRHFDQLQNLASQLNVMIRKTRHQLNLLKNNFGALRKKIDSIEEQDMKDRKRALLSELKTESEKLDKIIKHFKS